MQSDGHFTKRKLWGGRFTGATDPLCVNTRMNDFNSSIHTWGKAMYAADIKGSRAYAKALHKAGILTAHEASEMDRGLQLVLKEWDEGKFNIREDDEDIFTANERRLSEIVGSAIGGKLHTGRSRNDQTTTDCRIHLMERVKDVEIYLKDLINVMVDRAEKETDAILPGYTHLQRAQPVRWSHFLLAHAQAFLLDLERLTQQYSRISLLPLGAGAMAGNPYELDREFLAQELGFAKVGKNSMHMVIDRDYVVEFLQWSGLIGIHMSRLAEDLIIYSSAEFGFVQLSDAYSTGSSIMPQKKNPDSLELIRGKSGRMFGQMSGVMMSLKGLPATYNKDMAEDKEALFDCIRTVGDVIRIMDGVVATLSIRPEKMEEALTMDMLATDLADYLVRKGVPFRETHHISGRAVALAEATQTPLSGLTLEQLRSLSDQFEEDVISVFDFEASVEKRGMMGPSRKGVEEQIRELRSELDQYKTL